MFCRYYDTIFSEKGREPLQLSPYYVKSAPCQRQIKLQKVNLQICIMRISLHFDYLWSHNKRVRRLLTPVARRREEEEEEEERTIRENNRPNYEDS